MQHVRCLLNINIPGEGCNESRPVLIAGTNQLKGVTVSCGPALAVVLYVEVGLVLFSAEALHVSHAD